MAKSPLPFLLAGGAALLLLKGRGKSDAKDEAKDEPKKDEEDKAIDRGETPATVEEVEKEADGSVKPPDGEQTSKTPVVDTNKPSGYSNLTRAQMMVVQTQLTKLGYDPGKIDGIWKSGGTTYAAVKKFQYDYDLTVDGKPGPITRGTLQSVIDGTYVEPEPTPLDLSGPSGYKDVSIEEMMDIQTKLTHLGFDPGITDGIWVYGGNTYNAVRDFQMTFGLTVDGKPGPQTQALLNEVYESWQNPLDPTPPQPIPEPAPEPVPADDPLLLVLDTKLPTITAHPDFKKPLELVESRRVSGLDHPKGYAYGWDIYQDYQTLDVDGRVIGAVMGMTPNQETSIFFYRSKSAADVPSINDRISGLADKLEEVAATLAKGMN